MNDMSNQSRHQKGAPASQGGKFAANDRPAGVTELVDETQALRDLGVTGPLTPYLADEPWQEGGPAQASAGAQVYTSGSGRRVILDIQDGRVNATSRTAEGWERKGHHWSDLRDGSTADVIASALHSAATTDIFSQQVKDERGEFELRGVYTMVYTEGGDLNTVIDVTDRRGVRTQISFWHGWGTLSVEQNHQVLEDDEAEEFLTTSAEQLLNADTWQEMLHTAAATMAQDEDILPKVREAATRNAGE